MLLISSAGRLGLRATVSPAASRTVKTVFSKLSSSRSDLAGVSQEQSACFAETMTTFVRLIKGAGLSPAAQELRVSVGQPHEELVLHLHRRLPEEGGRSVVQSRRPDNASDNNEVSPLSALM